MMGILSKTEPASSPIGNEDLDQGIIRATGIGLREGELRAVEAIAKELGVKRNAMMRFAVRWFIMQYRAGKIDLGDYLEPPPPTKNTLRMP